MTQSKDLSNLFSLFLFRSSSSTLSLGKLSQVAFSTVFQSATSLAWLGQPRRAAPLHCTVLSYSGPHPHDRLSSFPTSILHCHCHMLIAFGYPTYTTSARLVHALDIQTTNKKLRRLGYLSLIFMSFSGSFLSVYLCSHYVSCSWSVGHWWYNSFCYLSLYLNIWFVNGLAS
ncbi:hypothetical protein BDV19DRAFT_170850 [Aspergillus venezuelensis]